MSGNSGDNGQKFPRFSAPDFLLVPPILPPIFFTPIGCISARLKIRKNRTKSKLKSRFSNQFPARGGWFFLTIGSGFALFAVVGAATFHDQQAQRGVFWGRLVYEIAGRGCGCG